MLPLDEPQSLKNIKAHGESKHLAGKSCDLIYIELHHNARRSLQQIKNSSLRLPEKDDVDQIEAEPPEQDDVNRLRFGELRSSHALPSRNCKGSTWDRGAKSRLFTRSKSEQVV